MPPHHGQSPATALSAGEWAITIIICVLAIGLAIGLQLAWPRITQHFKNKRLQRLRLSQAEHIDMLRLRHDQARDSYYQTGQYTSEAAQQELLLCSQSLDRANPFFFRSHLSTNELWSLESHISQAEFRLRRAAYCQAHPEIPKTTYWLEPKPKPLRSDDTPEGAQTNQPE